VRESRPPGSVRGVRRNAHPYRDSYHAREVMAQVGKESRFQTWNSITVMVLLGVILGAFGSYFFFNRELGQVDDRLDSMQQMMTPAAPAFQLKGIMGTKGVVRQ
jgi:hypothetical protein